MTPQDRPPLKNILPPGGTFVLKLIKPKDDEAIAKRFKLNKANFASCNLFFMDGDGNCLTKNFTAQWPKGLAMLVGKFSGKYCPVAPENITPENLYRYVEPALGKTANVTLEVTEDPKPWQGKTQYRYKFVKIEGIGSEARAIYKPKAEEQPKADPFDAPDSGAIPF
jgi:hypothetical protein